MFDPQDTSSSPVSSALDSLSQVSAISDRVSGSDPLNISGASFNKLLSISDSGNRLDNFGALNLIDATTDWVVPIPKSDFLSKISSDLTTVYKRYQGLQQSGFALGLASETSAQIATAQTKDSTLGIDDSYISIEVVASHDTNSLLADLQVLGLQNSSSYGEMISGQLPIAALSQLAQLDSLQFARPVYDPITHVGRTTSQGDISMRADVARRTFGVSGSGVRVGVLSDSFNNLGGAATDIATGDLPSNTIVLRDASSGGTDEGRAMMQLIHDVAPNASLAFYTANGGEVAFANGILALAKAGAKVIVDDVGYFTEPMFQDGIVAQAIDAVTAQGVSYFSSAGNSGDNSYQASFNPGRFVSGFGVLHDFDPGSGFDPYQSVFIGAGSTFTISLQWDSPFFSLNRSSGGSRSDLDLYLFDSADNIVAESIDNNLGNDPVEILQFTNDGRLGTNFNLVIANAGGTNPGFIKYVSFGNSTINEYTNGSSTLFGHANARGANAVGAAPFSKTPAYGTSPAQVEDFSSVGITPVLFDTHGNHLTRPEYRAEPTFVAPDGTNTTFFGSQSNDGDSFPNFFGTSAAAPHAAAVAALMLQANPNLSPSSITQILENTALDMDNPATLGFDAGYDIATGYGFIQADRAVAASFRATANINTLATAQDLGLLVGTEAMQDFTNANNPINIYRLDMSAPGILNAPLSNATDDTNLFLIRDSNTNNILDSDEILAATQSLGNVSAALNFRDLAIGTYYVGVQGHGSNTSYTLTLTTSS